VYVSVCAWALNVLYCTGGFRLCLQPPRARGWNAQPNVANNAEAHRGRSSSTRGLNEEVPSRFELVRVALPAGAPCPLTHAVFLALCGEINECGCGSYRTLRGASIEGFLMRIGHLNDGMNGGRQVLAVVLHLGVVATHHTIVLQI